MHKVKVSRELKADVKTVWAVLDDFAGIYKYNPGVKSSEVVSKEQTGKGAQRICYFDDETSLKETITHYNPMRGYAFDLSEYSLPLKEANTRVSIKPVDAHSCEVSVILSFIPKFGPLGWLMGKLLMKPMLTKALKGLTKGLDDHVRTGMTVLSDGSLQPAI